MRRQIAPPRKWGPKLFGHLTLNTKRNKLTDSSCIEFDLETLFTPITDNGHYQFDGFFVIAARTNPRQVIRGTHPSPIDAHDAIAGFDPGKIRPSPGTHFS